MRLLRVLDGIISVMISVLYASIIVAMFGQVLFRYILGSPFTWSEEISRYMFIWLTYLGAYAAIERKGHIAVDFFTRYLPPTPQRYLSIVLSLLVACVLAFVFYLGVWMTLENIKAEWQTIPFLSMGLSYAAVPVGACLMILGLLRVTVREFTKKEFRANKEPGATY